MGRSVRGVLGEAAVKVIPIESGTARETVFGGVEDVDQFPGGDVVEEDLVGLAEPTQAFVEPGHRFPEQDPVVLRDAAVGV
jgi:hypothetical protein